MFSCALLTSDFHSWTFLCGRPIVMFGDPLICLGCLLGKVSYAKTKLRDVISSGSGSYPLRMSWLSLGEKKIISKGFSHSSSWKLLVIQLDQVIMFPGEHTPKLEMVKDTGTECTGLFGHYNLSQATSKALDGEIEGSQIAQKSLNSL